MEVIKANRTNIIFSQSNNQTEADKFAKKIEKWEQKKAGEGRDVVAQYMWQAYKNQDPTIMFYRTAITSFPPLYDGATTVITVDSPSLLNAPLVGVLHGREVCYLSKHLYAHCPGLTFDKSTPSYINELHSWYDGPDQVKRDVGHYLAKEYFAKSKVLYLCGFSLAEFPPIYKGVTHIVVEDCPGLLHASVEEINAIGAEIILVGPNPQSLYEVRPVNLPSGFWIRETGYTNNGKGGA